MKEYLERELEGTYDPYQERIFERGVDTTTNN